MSARRNIPVRDFDEDDEGPSQADLERFGGDDVPCPSCGADVYHDAPFCPRCGHAIMESEIRGRRVPPSRRPWFVAAALLALIAFVIMAVW